MMNGMGMSMMMFWMPVGILLSIILVVVVIWILIQWLNKQKGPTTLYNPPRQDDYEQPSQSYRQGYQPQQQMPETCQEGEQRQYPQPEQEDEQLQVSYPKQEMPEQR